MSPTDVTQGRAMSSSSVSQLFVLGFCLERLPNSNRLGWQFVTPFLSGDLRTTSVNPKAASPQVIPQSHFHRLICVSNGTEKGQKGRDPAKVTKTASNWHFANSCNWKKNELNNIWPETHLPRSWVRKTYSQYKAHWSPCLSTLFRALPSAFKLAQHKTEKILQLIYCQRDRLQGDDDVAMPGWYFTSTKATLFP